ncbi:DNA-binding MarR family transcriptional regulator [Promicromonospora sp. AC04]|uniref:MarR family winged helix-turn-helix transcriptional regulator n=1 Tax=Promicromonospora sp. AC04 TaxID=2135723 RepID=UPI000D340474|nr:winged helix DNA-binding protein [Promicromonospora sp. AC04]PUB25972.1 DNA-binding MarR family transcriptional regulator [Promicromonospora sp. AC04]
MRPAEELRYLVLAIQREGNRLLASELRPLGVTPSQAEVVRVLADYQPLTLAGLGELLVCETGGSPSRLVDRLVTVGLVDRGAGATDRRRVTLALTADGERLAARIAEVEERLYERIDGLTTGTPVSEALTLLRAFAGAFPAGQAVVRRGGAPAEVAG